MIQMMIGQYYCFRYFIRINLNIKKLANHYIRYITEVWKKTKRERKGKISENSMFLNMLAEISALMETDKAEITVGSVKYKLNRLLSEEVHILMCF